MMDLAKIILGDPFSSEGSEGRQGFGRSPDARRGHRAQGEGWRQG